MKTLSQQSYNIVLSKSMPAQQAVPSHMQPVCIPDTEYRNLKKAIPFQYKFTEIYTCS